MASSSLSQEDIDHEYEVQCSRRSRVRTARATRTSSTREVQEMGDVAPLMVDFPAVGQQQQQQEYDASPKPRAKDKRCPRPNHANKVKVQRERRKLREKRRSTGVVHLQSTESTGGSTGEEEEELLNVCAETRRNTTLNETSPVDTPPLGAESVTEAEGGRKFSLRNNKSPSDLDADDEDNQDYDSAVNQSDSTMSLAQESALCELLGKATAPTNGRPQTPCSERPEELLERAREENCRLLDLLKEKDVRIHTLERKVITLGKELGELMSENRELRERNATLLGSLAAK
ncbi:PRKC apoptosis WT1 regulator protein-like [Ornithodoros turicata]|uniref:PRKC apoptosis WT1 regulator protein-like n=1 Tax=Ornithodoros turicata TaxID=34597 RepID=UPI003139613D